MPRAKKTTFDTKGLDSLLGSIDETSEDVEDGELTKVGAEVMDGNVAQVKSDADMALNEQQPNESVAKIADASSRNEKQEADGMTRFTFNIPVRLKRYVSEVGAWRRKMTQAEFLNYLIEKARLEDEEQGFH